MKTIAFASIKKLFTWYHQKRILSLWENVFAIFVLFLSTYAVIPLLQAKSGLEINPVQGNIVMQALWLGIYAITFFILLLRIRNVFQIAFQAKLQWVLVELAFVSTIWSEKQFVALRHCLALLGTTVFGVYLATRFTRKEILSMLAWTLGLVAVLSLGFVWLLPGYGIHHDYYGSAWRGVYIHKNLFGNFMALAALTWLLYAFSCQGKLLVGLVFFFLSLALLFLSTSKTALIIFFILLSLLSIIQILRRLDTKALPVGILLIVLVGSLAILSAYNMENILTILGRDTTLTGRIYLWQAVWLMIQEHPWLGYGYNAFWLEREGPSKYIWEIVQWEPFNAHNGYLDLWLQLGLVGVVIFIIPLLVNLFKAFTLVWREKGLVEMFPLLFLAFMMIHNISESTILVRNQIFWILYVMFSIQLSTESGKVIGMQRLSDGSEKQ